MTTISATTPTTAGQTITVYYITCPDLPVAKTLGRQLLEQRLAACVNILPHMHSMYHWQEAIESGEEVVLLAKSTADKKAAIEDFMDRQHPYSTPCVMGVAAASINKAYEQWLHSNLL